MFGTAEYTDDTPPPPGTLHGWLVRAERAPATLLSVDADAARAAAGVEAVLLAADLPEDGVNSIGGFIQDEQLFAETEVLHVARSEAPTAGWPTVESAAPDALAPRPHPPSASAQVGQVVGLVVATSQEEARRAARLVNIEYGPPPDGVTPVYSIEDAVAAGSYYPSPFDKGIDLERGPTIESALAEPGVTVVQGEFKRAASPAHRSSRCPPLLGVPSSECSRAVVTQVRWPGALLPRGARGARHAHRRRRRPRHVLDAVALGDAELGGSRHRPPAEPRRRALPPDGRGLRRQGDALVALGAARLRRRAAP